MQADTRNTKRLLWVNRAIRWGMGITFIAVGWKIKDEGRWFALVFGTVFIISGFFRPRRCLEDNCPVD